MDLWDEIVSQRPFPTEVTMSINGEMCPVSHRGCWKSLVSYLKSWDPCSETKAPCQADVRMRNCPSHLSRPSFHLSPTALGDTFPSSVTAGQHSPVRKPCSCVDTSLGQNHTKPLSPATRDSKLWKFTELGAKNSFLILPLP